MMLYSHSQSTQITSLFYSFHLLQLNAAGYAASSRCFVNTALCTEVYVPLKEVSLLSASSCSVLMIKEHIQRIEVCVFFQLSVYYSTLGWCYHFYDTKWVSKMVYQCSMMKNTATILNIYKLLLVLVYLCVCAVEGDLKSYYKLIYNEHIVDYSVNGLWKWICNTDKWRSIKMRRSFAWCVNKDNFFNTLSLKDASYIPRIMCHFNLMLHCAFSYSCNNIGLISRMLASAQPCFWSLTVTLCCV